MPRGSFHIPKPPKRYGEFHRARGIFNSQSFSPGWKGTVTYAGDGTAIFVSGIEEVRTGTVIMIR